MQTYLNGKGQQDLANAQVEAVRVAALTLSVKGGEPGHLAAARRRALLAADLIKDKKDLAKARNLAGSLAQAQGRPEKGVPDLTKHLDDVVDLMNLYRMKSKGGEGIATALQSTGPLKKQNGIEEKVRYLVRKKLTADKLATEADDLALLGYKMAVDGALTATFAPTQKKGVRDWRDLSRAMRDSAIRLAEPA